MSSTDNLDTLVPVGAGVLAALVLLYSFLILQRILLGGIVAVVLVAIAAVWRLR